MGPKVKFITAVWGKAYIARFASLSLPSFLAPGNLPALAEATELEVVIMTRHHDIAFFEAQPAFHRLQTFCAVRFMDIEDLITTGLYGVTLTLAYARAVIASGREMLHTHFVFMNADFVLADGSLRSLCKHIVAGRSIVLGPSFRATAEALEPVLQAEVDSSSNELAISPRRLTALSLPHPHRTTLAKTVTQGFFHSIHPNQFFWQVDEKTILGRYYLIFMLCLKPERVIEKINCFCDYAFIPEMCPSGDEAIMNDSDDFFMLELQARDQEGYFLRLGRQTDSDVANSLQSWTTAEHRRAAGYDVVFHTDDLPAGIETAKAEARAFIEKIGKQLKRPVPHDRHRYWSAGVQAWRHCRLVSGLSASPPELATPRRGFRSIVMDGIWSLIYNARRNYLAEPAVTPLHPDWLDYEHLRAALATIVNVPGAHALLVRDDDARWMDNAIPPNIFVDTATPSEIANDWLPPARPGSARHNHVLIYLQRKHCRLARSLVEKCESLLESGGRCSLFIHHLHGETEHSNFSFELLGYLDDVLVTPIQAVECSFVGGSLLRFYRKVFLWLLYQKKRFGNWALAWIAPVLLIELAVVLIGNVSLRRKYPTRYFVDYCTSAWITFMPPRNAPRRETSGSRVEPVSG